MSAKIDGSAFLLCMVSGVPTGTPITYQWRRPDMSSTSGVISQNLIYMYIPHVGVSDAGVNICEVTINESANNPYIISQSASVHVTLTVTGK